MCLDAEHVVCSSVQEQDHTLLFLLSLTARIGFCPAPLVLKPLPEPFADDPLARQNTRTILFHVNVLEEPAEVSAVNAESDRSDDGVGWEGHEPGDLDDGAEHGEVYKSGMLGYIAHKSREEGHFDAP